MKTIIWKTPNKMDINTGHKTFDEKCVVVSTGNVCSPTQTSCYIRPRTETQCNGFTKPEGHLRDFDLHVFTHAKPCIPSYVLNRVRQETEDKQILLYRIFHLVGERRIDHGWILTKDHKEDHELIAVFYSNFRKKTFAIMDEIVQYVSNPPRKEAQKTA